jgi:hypothetical protein
VGPLIAVLIFFGVYPKPLLDVINPAVHDTLSQVHVTDPRPQHPGPPNLIVHGGFGASSGKILLSAGGAQHKKGNTP